MYNRHKDTAHIAERIYLKLTMAWVRCVHTSKHYRCAALAHPHEIHEQVLFVRDDLLWEVPAVAGQQEAEKLVWTCAWAMYHVLQLMDMTQEQAGIFLSEQTREYVLVLIQVASYLSVDSVVAGIAQWIANTCAGLLPCEIRERWSVRQRLL